MTTTPDLDTPDLDTPGLIPPDVNSVDADSLYTGHYIPGAGRTVQLTMTARF